MCGVLAMAVISVTVSLLWPWLDLQAKEDSRVVAVNQHLATTGVERSRIRFVIDSKGRPSGVATTKLKSGDAVMSVPVASCADTAVIAASPIGALVMGDETKVANAVLLENGLSTVSLPDVLAAAYMAAEERKGPGSPWVGFFAAIANAEAGGALTWPKDVAKACLEPRLRQEGVMSEDVVNATTHILAQLCAPAADADADAVARAAAACPSKPFAKEDVKRALHVYTQHNYHTVLIPGVVLLRFDNAKKGIGLRLSQDGKAFDVVVQQPVRAGEEVVVNFLRGPGPFFHRLGVFRPDTAKGVELSAVVSQESEAGRLACTQQIQDMVFAANGFPHPALVRCAAVMVAPEKLKMKIAKKGKIPAEIKAYALGNLSYAAQHVAEGYAEPDYSHPLCNSSIGRQMKALGEWSLDVLKRNQENLKRQYEAAASEAGIPTQLPPMAPPPMEPP